MDKKILLIVWLVTTMIVAANAQKWDFDAHAGVNTYGFCDVNKNVVNGNKMSVGFEAGVGARYHIGEGFFMQTGLDLLKNGGKFDGVDASRMSLAVPLMLGYGIRLSEKVSLLPRFGVYGSYAMKNIADFNRFDMGLKAGVDVNICKNMYVGIGITRGLTKQSSFYDVKNQTVSFVVGYRW